MTTRDYIVVAGDDYDAMRRILKTNTILEVALNPYESPSVGAAAYLVVRDPGSITAQLKAAGFTGGFFKTEAGAIKGLRRLLQLDAKLDIST